MLFRFRHSWSTTLVFFFLAQVRKLGHVLKRLSPKDVTRGLRRHPMVFEGREAVKLFQDSGVANNPTDALAIGNAFLRENDDTAVYYYCSLGTREVFPRHTGRRLSCVNSHAVVCPPSVNPCRVSSAFPSVALPSCSPVLGRSLSWPHMYVHPTAVAATAGAFCGAAGCQTMLNVAAVLVLLVMLLLLLLPLPRSIDRSIDQAPACFTRSSSGRRCETTRLCTALLGTSSPFWW